ncbi:MAG TPA: 6,7-dimethyl-8-ribityllumazine synthase [Verrucomicrobiae bacterium]|nr:6,7-dimethyl-8-ribityllumazine synthase [Verrucomicrobiae bacterium]
MRFGIVCSKFNARYTDALLASAQEVLCGHEVAVVRVPGSFEIPLVLDRLARRGGFDALIALGLIWRGETDHAELIATECARACMDIALRRDIPVIFEVVTVRTEAQARARCLGKKLNRGRDAAATALAMADLRV